MELGVSRFTSFFFVCHPRFCYAVKGLGIQYVQQWGDTLCFAPMKTRAEEKECVWSFQCVRVVCKPFGAKVPFFMLMHRT